MISQERLTDFAYSSKLEWIETNGLGGYASSTVAGVNTRKYHGLLVASIQPPVDRRVVVSRLDETIVWDNDHFELGTNQFPGALHPTGFQYLKNFSRDLFPEFIYQAGSFLLKKTVAAIYGENTTVVLYEVLDAPGKFQFNLKPFYACRSIHHLSKANDAIGKPYVFYNDVLQSMNYHGCPEFFISVPKASFTEHQTWYYNFEYLEELNRGLDFTEDLYTHGTFTVTLRKGGKLGIIVSTEDPSGKDAYALFRNEKKRREEIVKPYAKDPHLKRLVLAADQFIVKRSELTSIIAGYHWFTDWGRDTMIALPGLCLATQRFTEARQILEVFASYISEGMLPNRFPDDLEQPEYNTMDATLWYFCAVFKYFQYTKDKLLIRELMPVLHNSIDGHYRGTRYHIRVDPADELLAGGAEGVQLTWMDAKVGDWVVTPRRGKPVEINALWYNALCVMEYLSHELNEEGDAQRYAVLASRVKKNFNEQFWYAEGKYLYDCIDGSSKSTDIRPNQIFAISLPFAVLEQSKFNDVLEVVSKHLFTPYGLRSLSPDHPEYKALYYGEVWLRDGAYHQGTAWGYLLGAYLDALVMCYGQAGKAEAKQILHIFLSNLDEAGCGTLSEIFDPEPPFTPRGCMAQAWSVAEALRVAVELELLPWSKTKAKKVKLVN